MGRIAADPHDASRRGGMHRRGDRSLAAGQELPFLDHVAAPHQRLSRGAYMLLQRDVQ